MLFGLLIGVFVIIYYVLSLLLLIIQMDLLPSIGKRELIFLLSITRNYVFFVRRGFFFLLALRIGCAISLWHSIGLPYNYSCFATRCNSNNVRKIA